LQQHLNLITDQQTEFTLVVVEVWVIMQEQVDQVVEVTLDQVVDQLEQLTLEVVVEMVLKVDQVELL
jgi:aspartyl-tRNA synthetase